MRYNQGNYYRPSFSGGFGFFPPVIKSLLIANVAVFLLQLFLSSYTLRGVPLEQLIYRYFALIPMGYGFKIWQLFTYMFLHSPNNFTHILFNMFALWMFGMELEHVLGSRKFFLYYILCGIGGGIANLLMGPLFQHPSPTIGASGAVYGVLLAFGLIFPDRLIFFYFLIPIKAKYFVLIYLGLEILAVGSSDMIAHLAHLGGALTGYIFLMADNKRIPFQWLFERVKKKKKIEGADHPYYAGDIENASYYDIKTGKRIPRDPNDITQEVIDEILDKISKSGYQSLTEKEKKILFEASKRLD
jgi:membrane associated rhomboid family serine protease